MNLKTYLAQLPAGGDAALSSECKATGGHIRNVASGFRAASPALASAIERATGGAVTRRDLRPDDWHLIWPELATSKEEASHG